MTETRLITLRRADRCARCATGLDAGVRAWWDPHQRTVVCSTCADAGRPVSSGTAGASAWAVGRRQRAAQLRRREDLKLQRPMLGRLQVKLAGPPSAGTSYVTGAVGEQKVGALLDRLASRGVLVLHDRRRPRTRANIDHVAISPTGIWVVDTKRYSGRIRKVDNGGWRREELHLKVNGRDRMTLIAAMHGQLADVRAAVAAGPRPGMPVHGVLCFVDGEFGIFSRPFEVEGVLVTWVTALKRRLTRDGPFDEVARAAMHRYLAATFPPAT